jgi:hypothetical protein
MASILARNARLVQRGFRAAMQLAGITAIDAGNRCRYFKYKSKFFLVDGGVAQLGARLNGIQKVAGSNPAAST